MGNSPEYNAIGHFTRGTLCRETIKLTALALLTAKGISYFQTNSPETAGVAGGAYTIIQAADIIIWRARNRLQNKGNNQ